MLKNVRVSSHSDPSAVDPADSTIPSAADLLNLAVRLVDTNH